MIHQQYPDVFGMACKLKVLEPLRILSDGGSWSLYELYAALVTVAPLGTATEGRARGELTVSTDIATLPSLSKEEPERPVSPSDPAGPNHASPLGDCPGWGDAGKEVGGLQYLYTA